MKVLCLQLVPLPPSGKKAFNAALKMSQSSATAQHISTDPTYSTANTYSYPHDLD